MAIRDIIASFRHAIHDPSGAIWDDSWSLSTFNEGEQDYCRRTHVYNLIQEHTTSYGVREVGIPDNFMGSLQVYYNNPSSTGKANWRPLTSSDVVNMRYEHPNFLDTSTDNYGPPQRYFIHNNEIILDPIPDASGLTSPNIVLYCDAVPSDHASLDEESVIPYELNGAMLNYLMARAKEINEDDTASRRNWDQYYEMVKEGINWKADRQQDEDKKVTAEVPNLFGFWRT